MKRHYVTADLEWPSEFLEPKITESDIGSLLQKLEINFSEEGIKKVVNTLRMYTIDKYNEEQKPVKKGQREVLKRLLTKAEQFEVEAFSFAHSDSSAESSEAYINISTGISLLLPLIISRLRAMKTQGQGKDGGAPQKVALMQLIQKL